MELVNEAMVARYAERAGEAAGVSADEGAILSAQMLASGGRVVVASDPAQRTLRAILAAMLAAGEDAPVVSLVVATAAEVTRLTPAFEKSGQSARVRVGVAESFIFAYLRGEGKPEGIAIVRDAEQTLLRDDHTPVILSTLPALMGAGMLTPETRAGADRTLVKGRDYLVEDGEIVICDPETGERFPGRRFSSGLHAAIQAREGVAVQKDGDVVAQITLGEYFRLYPRLSGVAAAWDERYKSVYGLTSFSSRQK